MQPNEPASNLDLLGRDLAFIDCEMNGGDFRRHEIIELGCVRSRLPDLPLLDQLGTKVAPRSTRGSNLGSVRIARYSPRDWRSAPPLESALDQLRQLAGGCLAVGWATHHDLLFLNAAAHRLGQPLLFQDGYLELQDWARDRFSVPRRPGLQRIADQLKIGRDQEHSALEDALVTYEVFRMLWRFDFTELKRVLPDLGWESYAELSGPIELPEEAIHQRTDELASYLINDVSDEALARRL